MTQTTHNDNLVIDGSRDVTQLTVEGAANQTTPLQKWQDGDQVVVAQVSSDGYFQIGDDLDTLRPPALVNIRRDRPAPIQGLSTQAKFSGAINTVLEWVSHKLELLGANGVSRRVSALRVQLTHNNSGVSADADLRAGDFEVVTQQSAGQAVAVHAAVTNQVGTTLTDGMGVQIDLQNAGTLTNAYGLKIEDVDQGTTNYAIQTGLGQVEFGGDVEVRGQLRAPTFTTTAAGLVPSPGNPTSRYLKDDGTWATIGTFTTTAEGFVPPSGDATGRFLKDDGTWAAIPTADGGQSPWSTNRRGIHYDTGRVGIGTDNPREDLHVVGEICIDGDAEFAEDVKIEGDLEVEGELTAPTFTERADGLVPNPGNATGRFLKDDGTWGTITSSSPSPWTKTGNDLHYSSGNVGIGGTPSNRLEVVDGNVSVSQRTEGMSAWARVRANAAPAYLQLEDSSSDNLWQMVHDGENANKLKIDYFDGTAKTTPLQIEKSAPTNSVYIKSDGKVGIGTASPAYELDVAGTGRFSGSVDMGSNLTLRPQDAIHEGAQMMMLGAGQHSDWRFDVFKSNMRFYTETPGSRLVQIFSTRGSVGLYVKGSTGIGTVSPTQKLDVRGNVRADDYIEYSKVFTGDALAAIKAIRPEATDAPAELAAKSDWAEVDHTTLPDGVKVAIQEEHYVNKHTSEQLAADKSPDQTDTPGDWELRTEETLARSVGAGVQLNLRAIQQLIEQNEQLQAHNKQIIKRLEGLEARAQ